MCTSGEVDRWRQMPAGLADLADCDVVGLSDEQVRSILPMLLIAENQLSALTAAVVGSFDARELADADGYRSTRTWLTAVGRMTQGAASDFLHRARLMRELPALAGAARSGAASAEHLGKVKDLAGRVGSKALTDFDEILADLAAAATPADVAKACERIAAHLDPDGEPPDPDDDFDRRGVSLARQGSMVCLRGRLDPEAGAALQTALDALTPAPTGNDLRTAEQRRADALAELARLQLAHGQLPTVAGDRPSLGILLTPQALLDPTTQPTPARPEDNVPTDDGHEPDRLDNNRDGGGTCQSGRIDALARAGVPPLPEPPWMSWIGEVPRELAQRIACDCQVWRAVLDPGTGLPLEVGRAHRIVPHWIRKALHARDRGCRWPGCDAPTEWTDAHHLIAWYYGGRTDIDNLLLLCRYHHSRVHEGHWQIRLDPNTGELYVTRPDGSPHPLGPTQPFTGPSSWRGDPPPKVEPG